MANARLAIDIGGTFTDVALDTGAGAIGATKVLTTHKAPEEGVIDGVMRLLAAHGLMPADVGLVLHGTTLATNAIIERKGAKTALVATEGFRDVLEIGYEDRYDQYDLGIEKPRTLVPRALRFTVPERVAYDGEVLKPLDEAAVEVLVPAIAAAGVEALAIAFIHAYARGDHEARARDILARSLPDISISISSEVSPEAREYERTVTTAVNAYVQPLMAGYLGRLEQRLQAEGFTAPVLLMTSGGGLTTLQTARRFPVRLVESGPAGGAILAAEVAKACGEARVLSFDMGGTTAKICLIDDGTPQTARVFEVDRQSRFAKGSGLPLRIPVIEMIEIGAGGGSIARLDGLGRITVGPDSAGSEPGPVAYGRGGTEPTVTDADLTLGRLDPDGFAGGTMQLDAAAAGRAIDRAIGAPLKLAKETAAFGISEIVDENMANAARVHAVENGVDVASRTLVAFGGAAPLHAGRLAAKLGIDRVIIPANAGVGSAIGFLHAPIAFEVVRGLYVRLADLDPQAIEALFAEMNGVARPIVSAAAGGVRPSEARLSYLRYVGQGHEVPVALPIGPLDPGDLRSRFEAAYRALFGRIIPEAPVEALSWSLAISTPARQAAAPATSAARPEGPGGAGAPRRLFVPEAARFDEVPVHARSALGSTTRLAGPLVITEAATTTVVPDGFDVTVHEEGHLVLTRRMAMREAAE
ncbi:hydantoinase/oxoprolinase family protein [Aurantimonas sp. 22II-16-19i]|uniref:hydantoinase/oxoprolinase family protein n=1 Tax=Aurantimonas sp. 22II-16-19i TaxID=1317114 RepID=UPI0009F7E3DC|nr:hydantoinase/oxoprolinase family protein [Aurantimonas sp. 22II-16-19i]ORE98961.1 hydantoin utilization protein [Aurantimonas sp. 22II-16-19i]